MTTLRAFLFVLLVTASAVNGQDPKDLTPLQISPLVDGVNTIRVSAPLRKGSLVIQVNGRALGSALEVTEGTKMLAGITLLVNQYVQVTFTYKVGTKAYTLEGSTVVGAAPAVSAAIPVPAPRAAAAPPAPVPVAVANPAPTPAKAEPPAPIAAAAAPELAEIQVEGLTAGDQTVRGAAPYLGGTVIVTAPGQAQKTTTLKDGAFEVTLDRPVGTNQEVDVRYCLDAACLVSRSKVEKVEKVKEKEKVFSLTVAPVKYEDQTVRFSIAKGSLPFDKDTKVYVERFRADDKGKPGELLNRESEVTCAANAVECTGKVTKLGFGEVVRVTAVEGEGDPFVGTASTGAEPTPPEKGILVEQPTEGEDAITGTVPKDTKALEVLVFPGVSPGVRKSIGTKLDVTFDKEKGSFSASAPLRLAEAQGVEIVRFDDKGKELGMLRLEVAPAGYDWGRVKAYFSLGTVVAQKSGKFNAAAPYLRFNMEYNFIPFRKLQPIVTRSVNQNVADPMVQRAYMARALPSLNLDRSKVQDVLNDLAMGKVTAARRNSPEGRIRSSIEEALRIRRNWHYMVTGYVDAQLNQTPVAATDTASKISSTTLQSSGSGYFEYGIYAPIAAPWTQWTFKNLDNALYMAPIVKFGFMTVGDNIGTGGLTPLVAPGVYKFSLLSKTALTLS